MLIFLSCIGKSQITMIIKEGGSLFMEGKDSIFFYQKYPKSKDGAYSRCNYLHPLYALDGSRLTEDFPADHLHHRGVFWAWHRVLIDNQLISDGWVLKNFEQKVIKSKFDTNNRVGIFTSIVDWKSPLWKHGLVTYLKEKTIITIFPRTDNYRQIDFEIRLYALTDKLSIGGYDDEKGLGGFSLRLKLPNNISFLGEYGKVEPTNSSIIDGNLMVIDGSFLNNSHIGVVIFSHPDNPTPSNIWNLRKTSSMQNVTYPGQQPICIPIKKPLILRYSLFIYQDNINLQQLKEVINKE